MGRRPRKARKDVAFGGKSELYAIGILLSTYVHTLHIFKLTEIRFYVIFSIFIINASM
jgi:hypothetical protein